MIEPSFRAYKLADRISALMHSDVIYQRTMSMEAMEFREFLACEIEMVLESPLRPSRFTEDEAPVVCDPPAPSDDPPEPSQLSSITHHAAMQTLQNAPKDVIATYRGCRRDGMTPAEAMEAAMEMFRRMQEAMADVSG